MRAGNVKSAYTLHRRQNTLGLSEFQFESLYDDLKQSFHSVDVLDPTSEGTCIDKDVFQAH